MRLPENGDLHNQGLSQIGLAQTPETEGGPGQVSSDKFLSANIANYVIFGSAILGLLYAMFAFL